MIFLLKRVFQSAGRISKKDELRPLKLFELEGEDQNPFPTEERIHGEIVYSLLDGIESYPNKALACGETSCGPQSCLRFWKSSE